ncbi:MAG: surface protein, partial [Flavipsychrobacter sp.]|nr:surface protein [Flavipsychrobacter sp.]
MTGVLAGNPIITYTTASGCTTTTVATVNPLPAAITGTMNVCVGLTTALTDATAGGTWTTSTSSVATVNSSTGAVFGVAAGTTTITYTISTGCINTAVVTVNPNPAAISGTPVVCAGLTTTLTDATAGGNWGSSNLTVASIGTTSGIMTGFAAGTTTITYMLPTGCIAIVTGTVNTLPAAISGTTNVCAGLTTALTDALTGGTWSSSTSSVATVGSSSGIVSGVAAGTTTITYKLPTGCINTVVVTVNPLPASITGTQVVCEAATTTLANATGFGAWSTANTTASVNSVSGVVTGVAAGTATVTYTLTTGCIATAIVTINPTPAITAGTGIVCVGLTTTLTGSGFGNWSSSNTAVATVGSGTGIVTGVSAGYPNISYTLATGCFATKVATVNPLPTAIIGTMSSCIGATSALSDATAGGVWTTSVSSVATVGSSSGIVSGVTAGTTTISYTLSATGCAMTGIFTVNPFPSAITGTMNTCPGATTALADASTFGNWSSSNTSVATIGSGTGIVSGVAAGTTTITYTLSTGCSITAALTVNPLPSAISGTMTVCAGLTTGLSDAGGGTWSTNNTTVATVNSVSGIVSGVSAGTTTITYTLGTGCQSMAAVTVYALPAPISGTLNVCAGLTTGLSDVTGSGTWTSSTSSVATVGSATGLVNGLVAGTSTITYMIPTGCISTATVTVNPLPAAIGGTTNVCVGLTTALTDATLSGAWSSSVTSVATVVSGSGVVTGVLAGTTTITYTLGTGCIMTTQLTVNPLPAAISGSATVCAGLTTTFSDGSTGGAWTSGNTSAATVNSLTGAVFGVAAGTSTITYTLPTGCINTKVITVNPLPANIAGITSVCIGLTTTLSDATGTGTWSSSDATLAPVGASTGIVSGLSVGTPTITYMLATGCIATTIVTVNPLPAAITGTMNVCVGSFTILSDATPSGVWSSSNTTVAPVVGGIVIGATAGTTTITYTLPTGCINTAVVTVNPLPAAISGTTNVCVGSTTALADASPFGTWSSSNSSIATVVAPTGVVSGLLAGTTTITYTLNTGCLITTPVTVNPLPSSITGTFTVCAGLSTALTDVGGGTWSSGNTTVATVTGLGIVNGLLAGTTTITYTLPTGCTAMATVTVNPLPASITGLNTVCNGLSINMSDATAGGTWSSSNSTVAVINSLTGGLTGNTAGTTTITYALTATGCINTTVVTVNPLPAAIAGTTNVCVGLTTTLSDATPSGTWASSNLSVATVGTSSGIVTGFAAGTATVTYALTTTGCIMTTPVTVNPLPSAITGTMNVCAGLSTQLTDAGGGTWSSSNTAIATVNVLGLVNGVLAGTATITYTLPTGCITTTIVTVNPLPSPIGGLNNVCFGLTTSLNDPTPFGLWSSSNTTVATIGSGTGLVSGLTVGSTTITYQLSTGCISTLAFTVNPLPTSILGNGAVCLGLTTTLSDATPLGAWSSSNTTVATIGSTSGVMSGMAVGTTTITYTLPTTCMITMTGTVNPLPAAITGATTHVCQGLSITMSDATTPGVWSSSNTGIATVNSSTGVVNGIAPGTMTLTYTLPTSCIMTTVITVDPLPATITGTMSVCAGLTTTLSDATPSGTWSSSNTAVATVAGNVVTGVVAGTATITYTLPTGCIMTAVVTVNPLPATITGTTSVCAGLTTTLSDATALGTWSSSNTTIATIGSGTGLVNGLTAGTATMTYKLTATGCIMTTSVTVNPLPASITGTMNVCAGLTTALSDITPSGVWSSSNTAVATAGSSTGVVTGVAAGTATITYTIPTGCIMTSVVTVNPLPASITGTMAVCAGLTTTLSDATPSGTWSSSNTAVATIAGNVVTGISAGTTTITYTLPTGCIMTAIVLVNPLPAPISGTLNVCAGLTTTLSDVDAGGTFTNDMTVLVTPLTITPGGVITGITAGTNIITYTLATGCITTSVATVNPLPLGIIGNSHVCAGLTISMSDATPGGSWTSSNANATIDISTGVVNGVTAGTSIITYMLPTGCIMTRVITVDPLPTAISGTLNVCAGLTTALSNGSTGGMWTVGSSTIATVNSSTGVVTGVMAGTTTITYTLPTGCIMTDMVTVNPLPATITGTTQVCVGLTTPLGTTTLGGSWSSSNTAIATVDASLGEVTGVLAGTAIITYTLPTGCIMTSVVTVNPLPGTISGTLKVCAGSMTTLTNTGGGSWTSSNMSVATVSGGVVSGIMYGTSTITYTLPTGCITTAVASVDSLPTV